MSAIAQQLPTGTWQADPVHSTVGFAVNHMLVSTFRGRFEDFDATLTVASEPALTGVVRADSVDVRDENLAAHLRAPDFFDAERHPEIRFESSSFQRDGDEIAVEGELTIKGATRPVTARGTVVDAHEDPWGNTRLGLELETTVDRREFGLDWNQPLPKGGLALGNDVTLLVNLELVRG